MQDQIIKGTGNSRFLKSSIPENITFEQFVSLLRAGIFPVDFNGLNDAGIEQLGTPINKTTLLKNSTVTKLGLTGNDFTDVTVDDALAELSLFAQLKAGEVSGSTTDVNIYSRSLNMEFPMPYVISGTYVGTGTAGSANPTVINYGGEITPKAIIVQHSNNENYYMISNYNAGQAKTYHYPRDSTPNPVSLTWNENSVEFTVVSGTSANNQLNDSGTVYIYTIIGTVRAA